MRADSDGEGYDRVSIYYSRACRITDHDAIIEPNE